jgi:hypothetical protein
MTGGGVFNNSLLQPKRKCKRRALYLGGAYGTILTVYGVLPIPSFCALVAESITLRRCSTGHIA